MDRGWIILIVLVAVGLVFGWLGYWLMRHGRGKLAMWLASVPTAIAGVLLFRSSEAQGWDALVLFLGALLFCAPPALGLWAGMLVGWLKQRWVERTDPSR
jgi:uncharacterized membrane protein YeaQ/YmgE (transglycosylase-associated protein family)